MTIWNLTKRYFPLVVFLLPLIYCSNPVTFPQDIPISELLSAPEIISVETQTIKLEASVYLNLQPMVPKTPMIAFVYIETVDSTNISSNINAKSIYIVHENNVWKSPFTSEERPEEEMRPYRIIEVARDGPHWEPEIYVDVIVRLEINNQSYLLRASNQLIGAAY